MDLDTKLFGKQNAFDVLIGDCLKLERFPAEIQVVGFARGWHNLIERMAARRGVKITITVEPIEG
jgi:hypothetical protein